MDWREPDYRAVYARRQHAREQLLRHPETLPAWRMHYQAHPAQFIEDWGVTYDPRNIERGLPAIVPFILFPKQWEFCEWVVDHWRHQKPGLMEKSRDVGASWLAVSLACTLCIFYNNMAIGFGSRKEIYVDQAAAPKSLFFKARMFMDYVPKCFRAGYRREYDAPHMRINFPKSGSHISGEAGDNIGRGDRTAIYFVDEAAHIERPDMVEFSLAQTTNCRIDMSSANGMANAFAQKRHSGRIDVFTLHWRDDPRKDDDWYEKQRQNLDAITLAQEIDIDYAASTEGVLIPSSWVQAAIDAHKKLGFDPVGQRMAAFDPADEGADDNALVGARGVLIEFLEQWSGKGSDLYASVVKAFSILDEHPGYDTMRYDADGLGASVRGDARIANEQRRGRKIEVVPFRGSGEIVGPQREDVPGRKNEDYFLNAKAQAWWSLRKRFETTYRAVREGMTPASLDDIISISSSVKNLSKLIVELSQPTYSLNNAGKIIVDKVPEGAKSPNLADAVMMRFAPVKPQIIVPAIALARSRRPW